MCHQWRSCWTICIRHDCCLSWWGCLSFTSGPVCPKCHFNILQLEFMVSSGHVCRQVVGRWSQVHTPTPLTLPVSISSNTHLFFSFPLSSKVSKLAQLFLLLLTPPHSVDTPETIFFTRVNSRLVSVELMILRLLIFLFFFFLSFFKHITTPSLFDRLLWLEVSSFMSRCFRSGKCLRLCKV